MNAIKNFVTTWKSRGYEKGETQKFWLTFLRDVLQIDKPENYVEFEVAVKLEHTNFIDAFFPDSKVIVEQKSLQKNLSDKILQSDKNFLTPYEQAQRYGTGLPYSMRPRWIIVCNFQEFLIYDMELMTEPTKILLEDLSKNFHAFDFLIDKTKNKIRLELELSLKAGEIVGKIYNALRKNYLQPDDEKSLQSLNKLCVRLVFCLYAESAGIFGKHKIFRDFLNFFPPQFLRHNLQRLFEILNTPEENREPYLEDVFKNFPYVNGNLFADKIEIPNFDDDLKNLLLEEAANFDWSGISPTIFGAVFESTLNPMTRRSGGMHYTSIENIRKVIDNLFLNDLQAEFAKIKRATRNRKKLLLDFQEKISQLKFFDPACGSGNFLTESFISLRRLENKILEELLQEKILLGELDNPVKVSIQQFFGIELNDFACSVSQSALWIAELQMAIETQNIIHRDLNFLPLKNFANIFEGNALTLDWQKVCPQPNFIFGNPPFVGKTFQTREQKADIKKFFKNSSVDYVACWFKKAADFIQNTKIEVAFVSTNSITQGEQVATVFENLPVTINFAYRTFRWDSESNEKAHVHCVIIAFANFHRNKKFIFDVDKKILAQNINGYLQDAPQFFLHKRIFPLQNFIPKMIFGNMANDGGNLILSEDEKNTLLKNFPTAKKFVKTFLGAEEFLHNKKRYCLWLVDASPSDIKKIPPIYERIKKIKILREKSSRDATKKLADAPHLFGEIRQPTTNFILIPRHSSENRHYIPIGFLNENIIASDANLIVPNADLFLFGILQSSVHMIWTKTFCGRLKSDFRYSAALIYNNFPFPEVDKIQREKISATAEKILQVRKKYSDSTLAQLYDPTLMPKDLRDAHKKNDLAVIETYGFNKKLSETQIAAELIKFAELLKLYQKLKD